MKIPLMAFAPSVLTAAMIEREEMLEMLWFVEGTLDAAHARLRQLSEFAEKTPTSLVMVVRAYYHRRKQGFEPQEIFLRLTIAEIEEWR